MCTTTYGLHLDGNADEACIRVWSDAAGQGEERVIEGPELQRLLPQIMALQSALAVVMRRRHTKA